MDTSCDPQPTHEHTSSTCQAMVGTQLRARGIRDPRILQAMGQVPRERFLPADSQPQAYLDRAVPIDCGQTISQPYMVAYMTELLDVRPGMRVLEVGTGSGYQCAILVRLGACVHTVERIDALRQAAGRTLSRLNLAPAGIHLGDGSAGWPSQAPYDRIIVTAAAPSVPRPLLEQLVPGGRLVLPVGGSSRQIILLIRRFTGRTVETPGLPCRFVRLIGRQSWPDAGDNPSPPDPPSADPTSAIES
ncbi:MAG: protein-L-isoaspartate(D-aspartate) O-methyltransferase [Phycisphaerae bacterium]